MPDKNIGFARTVTLNWLDLTASLRLNTDERSLLRTTLDKHLRSQLKGTEFRRKTIDVLIGIWYRSATTAPTLHAAALQLFAQAYTSAEHKWLHYGLAMVQYPLFRYVVEVIGQLGRLQETLTRKQIKSMVAAEWGHLGDLDRSVERICASLTEWGLFPEAEKRYTYRPMVNGLHTENTDLQAWLLACALHAHPDDSLLIDDLLRLPELFPFHLTLDTDALRRAPWFSLYREANWVRVALQQNQEG